MLIFRFHHWKNFKAENVQKWQGSIVEFVGLGYTKTYTSIGLPQTGTGCMGSGQISEFGFGVSYASMNMYDNTSSWWEQQAELWLSPPAAILSTSALLRIGPSGEAGAHSLPHY